MKLAVSFELGLLPAEKFENDGTLVSGTGVLINKSQRCAFSY